MTTTQWEILKWGGNVCFIFATSVMLSPHVAGTCITPWTLFLIGNVIWFADSVKTKNYPWVTISFFFIVWDAVIIITRMYGGNAFEIVQPLITIMEKLP